MQKSQPFMGFSENRGYPFWGFPLRGIIFYLGFNRGTPIFWEMPNVNPFLRSGSASASAPQNDLPVRFLKVQPRSQHVHGAQHSE